MTGIEFLEQLKRNLRGLPAEEFCAAMDYYTGYIHDAGEENESAAVAGLGSPPEVAAQIIAEFAVKPSKRSAALMLSPMMGVSKVWAVILAIFAAPIALPIAIAAAAVAFALLITLAALVFALGVSSIALTAAGAFSVIVGILVVFQDMPNALLTAGLGLVSLGVGVLLIKLTIIFSRVSFDGVARVFGKFIIIKTAKIKNKKLTNNMVKIAPILIIAGLILGITGWLFGARGGVYFDKNGVHAGDPVMTDISRRDIDAFTAISVNVQYADIELIASDYYGIEIHVSENSEPSWNVQNGKLAVESRSGGFRLELFSGFSAYEHNYIKIYYPAGTKLSGVSLTTGSGDIKVSDASISDLTIKDAYGDFDVKNLTAAKVSIDMSSGEVSAANLRADSVVIKNNYGSITIDDMTAESLEAKLSSGSITVSDSALGSFDVKNSYGDVNADNLTSSGMTIDVSSGDISLEGALEGLSNINNSYGKVIINTTISETEYQYDIVTKYGGIWLNGKKHSGNINDSINRNAPDAPNEIVVRASSGDVQVGFGDR